MLPEPSELWFRLTLWAAAANCFETLIRRTRRRRRTGWNVYSNNRELVIETESLRVRRALGIVEHKVRPAVDIQEECSVDVVAGIHNAIDAVAKTINPGD